MLFNIYKLSRTKIDGKVLKIICNVRVRVTKFSESAIKFRK